MLFITITFFFMARRCRWWKTNLILSKVASMNHIVIFVFPLLFRNFSLMFFELSINPSLDISLAYVDTNTSGYFESWNIKSPCVTIFLQFSCDIQDSFFELHSLWPMFSYNLINEKLSKWINRWKLDKSTRKLIKHVTLLLLSLSTCKISQLA